MQGKSNSILALIETAKIDHIRSKLKDEKYFSILDICSGYHHISIHPDSGPKTKFICPYRKSQWKSIALCKQHQAFVSKSNVQIVFQVFR